MPAKSEAQRRLMAIAEHHPEEVYGENRSVLKMSHRQLHDFAATKGLHEKKRKRGKSDVVSHVYNFRRKK